MRDLQLWHQLGKPSHEAPLTLDEQRALRESLIELASLPRKDRVVFFVRLIDHIKDGSLPEATHNRAIPLPRRSHRLEAHAIATGPTK